jgi:UDP-N-acetylbacillosamine N-acetyltransferase
MLDDKLPGLELSAFEKYISPNTVLIPAFGNNEFRLSWCEKIIAAGGTLATLIHPTAYISPLSSIAHGTVILPHAIINTNVVVEKGCIINLGAIVDHDCIIEEGVHLCLGCIVKGENRVERLSKIEAGEVIPARQWPVNKA